MLNIQLTVDLSSVSGIYPVCYYIIEIEKICDGYFSYTLNIIYNYYQYEIVNFWLSPMKHTNLEL